MRTLLVEARETVGGTAASEPFAGATVNICNCDHMTFRTTPIVEELDLASFGLRYNDMDPSQVNMAWGGGPAWATHHDIERTIDSIGRSYPGEVAGYRAYLRAALPAVRLVLEAANEPPSFGGLAARVLRARGRGASTLLRWSRRSAADVMRQFFRTDALQAPGLLVGPMVWGISPEFSGSGLGALTYAFRHVGKVGRPVGGSGMVTDTIRLAFERHGGTVMTGTKVAAIECEGERVRGVVLSDGQQVAATVVVSACNPHDTFLHWLRNPPSQAHGLVKRWKAIPHADGYESKIDAVLTSVPRVRAAAEAGIEGDTGATFAIAPSIRDMHRGWELMQQGQLLDRPGFLANVPTVEDPGMAPAGRHVFSLEALFTPYAVPGGWASSQEPKRWLDLFAELAEPGFEQSIVDWRAMTPERYETDFHLPHGHATSFAGGPLAAIRNANPELTRYETAVKGLYLTGAATFPGAGVWGASGRNAATVVLRRR